MKNLVLYALVLVLVPSVFLLGIPIAAYSTVGWEVGDIVLDFGLDLES